MSQFKFTNQRGISTVYLLKRLQTLNTFMIYRHTTYGNTYIIYSIFIQLKKGKYGNLSKWKTWQQQHVKQLAWKMSKNCERQRLQLKGKRAREVREKWERERETERIALNCLRNLMTAVHDTRKWPKQTNKLRVSWETSHKLTDFGEEKESGRKNYFRSIKFNEKLHTAIAEG